MSEDDVNQTMAQLRVVPAVVIDDVSAAEPMAEAMVRGGLPVVEVTLRTPHALESIRMLSRVEGLLVGAGTVTSLEQLGQALSAGARFVVTPGLDPEIVKACQGKNVEIFPGAVTPTEIMQAMNLGLPAVKFFPSNVYGGLAAIEALSGPFPAMKFMPTGGVNLANLAAFLSHPNVLACGGTWMAKREWIREGKFDEIENACRETIQIVRSLKPA
ncbi:MAG TPA: bifunctional 4-hydroxy-2-oxoglutarate aldolase/2-dehydro-3-deoxy-phosphogluconate aldolase [Prosthecobacter sp.]